MKKIVLILSLLIIIIFAGCAVTQKKNIPENKIPSATEIQVTETKDYKSVKSTEMPANVSEYFKSFGSQTGAFIYQHPEYTYLKIVVPGTGTKIASFISTDYEKNVNVTYTKANTNETLILKVANKYVSNFKVSANGEPLNLGQKYIPAVLDSPADNAEITNPVTVKGKIAVFEATFVIRIVDANGKILKEEQVMASEGAPAWGTFEKSISYQTPTTATGSIVAIEYSAKDGTPIPHAAVNVKFKK